MACTSEYKNDLTIFDVKNDYIIFASKNEYHMTFCDLQFFTICIIILSLWFLLYGLVTAALEKFEVYSSSLLASTTLAQLTCLCRLKYLQFCAGSKYCKP